tara:strand:- start:427 stop:777 length:351 start_codon:yes stop_codon:yes gene_type:complete
MENKEYLQEKINDIETQIQELNNQLSTTQHELKVIGKPIINKNIYELLQDSIRSGIDDIEFGSDDFDIELIMNYDNTVQIDNLIFNSQEDMYNDIISRIDKQFRVIENEENPTHSE